MHAFKMVATLGVLCLSAVAPVGLHAQSLTPEQKAWQAWQLCIARSDEKRVDQCAALEPPKPSHVLPEGAARPNFETAAEAYVLSSLKDPESARIRLLRGARKGRLPITELLETAAGSKPAYGWMACYAVNAKNSYGGYVGEHRWVVILEDGRWRSITDQGSGGGSIAAAVMDAELRMVLSKECRKTADQLD